MVISEFEARISKLTNEKILVLACFCGQVTFQNIEIYLDSIKFPRNLPLKKQLEDLWEQIFSQDIQYPYEYEEIKDWLIRLFEELARYPKENGLHEKDATMLREAIFSYASMCSFFCQRGAVAQLLTVMENSISCKVDWFYFEKLRRNVSLSEINKFPLYQHALSDFEWVIDKLEGEPAKWPSLEVMQEIKIYGTYCDTFVIKDLN